MSSEGEMEILCLENRCAAFVLCVIYNVAVLPSQFGKQAGRTRACYEISCFWPDQRLKRQNIACVGSADACGIRYSSAPPPLPPPRGECAEAAAEPVGPSTRRSPSGSRRRSPTSRRPSSGLAYNCYRPCSLTSELTRPFSPINTDL